MMFFRRKAPTGKPNNKNNSAANSPRSRISLGFCCMSTKLNSKPMQALISRLEKTGVFEIMQFSEETILNEPVESWPVVQGLIAFHSSGFPLEKAVEYAKLRKPVELNRLDIQQDLRDRVKVYEKLKAYEVPVPNFMVIDHADPQVATKLEEDDDFIVYEGVKLSKPFVEKPLDADDHNIWVYYPVTNVGGGCKKLIRKVDDKSSEFSPLTNRVRRDKAYIYEPFLPTQGMDVKVYTVGTEYSHAEARKAPTVDGKVLRAPDGKEVRYPITLTETEKACGALIVKAFNQYICGFDVLRTNGGSLVCDVNGFSFVKGNRRYYDDCAYLVTKYFLEHVHHTPISPTLPPIHPTSPSVDERDELHLGGEDDQDAPKLRSVIVIMRHADRKPKEKFKFETIHPIFAEYLGENAGAAEVLLKTPEQLIALLEKLKLVDSEALSQEDQTNLGNVQQMLEMRDTFSGLTRKVQIKKVATDASRVMVVGKWGGDLTILGRSQAEELGRSMRSTLFADEDCLLRLHSSFRHDFRIYSSQEGRCQSTAAAFTKGFLDLDGDLAPILVSLISADDFAHDLLDHPIPKQDRDIVKRTISDLLHSDKVSDELARQMVPKPGSQTGLAHAVVAIMEFGSPLEALKTLASACEAFIASIHRVAHGTADPCCADGGRRVRSPFGPKVPKASDIEKTKRLTLLRIEHRWQKILAGFRGDTDGNAFDVSKVPEIFDSVVFDLQHNLECLGAGSVNVIRTRIQPVLNPLHAWISGCEFGISEQDKMRIGTAITWRLLQKLLNDVEYMVDDSSGSLLPLSSSASGNCVQSHNSPKGAEEAAAGSVSLQSPLPSSLNSPGNPAMQGGKRSKVPPELRTLMRQAMRDGSDWHPKLRSTVARLTGMESEEVKTIRTRVYVTSASTMHSLMNVLNSDEKVVSSDALKDVTDLHYLSHVVIRCFEDPAAARELQFEGDGQQEKLAQYSVEISFSPGVTEDGQSVLPAASIGPCGFCCSLEDLDNHLSNILAESGHLGPRVNMQRVNVFERKPSVRSEVLSPLVAAHTNAVVAADGSVWLSTRSGDLFRIDRGLQVSKWGLPGFPIVRGLRATKHQVVVWGREGSEETFRAYHIFKLSGSGVPTKLRDGRISVRATAFDISHSMSWAALGLETGQVLLARGCCDFLLQRGFQAEKRPITALNFVEKDGKIFLFVFTEASLGVFSLGLDGAVTKEISDSSVGVKSQSFLARSGGFVFVASDAAVFTIDPVHGNISVLPREAHTNSTLRGIFPWRGSFGEISENVSMVWSHGSSRFLAFSGNFSSPLTVVAGAFDGRSALVLESSGDVTEIVEHPISDQLGLLVKKSLHELAIELATQETQSAETISDLHKLHASHLMEIGNFKGAMSVFSRAMERKLPLEISHVIRVCLSRPGDDGIQAAIEFLTKFPSLTLRTQELVIACYKMIGNLSGLRKFLASLSDAELVHHADEAEISDLLVARADFSPNLFLPALARLENFHVVSDKLLQLPLSQASEIFAQLPNKEELVVAHPEIAGRFPEADRLLIHGRFLRGERVGGPEVVDYEDDEGLLMALEVALRTGDDAAMRLARLAVTKGLARRVLVLANIFGQSEISEYATKAANLVEGGETVGGRAKKTMEILRRGRRTAHMRLGEVKEDLISNLRRSEEGVTEKRKKILEDEREIQKMKDERKALLEKQRIIQPQNKPCFACKRNLLESSLIVYFNCGHNYHVHCATSDLKDPPLCRVCMEDATVKKKLRISRAVSCTKEDEMIKYLSNAENKFCSVIANYAGRGLFASNFL